ncbi:class I glutamine amidotransferase-like protein [Ophiobolus disseminans]|uniref:Class I glutamine amidotransferase-like protein n=1 Tax=Ophiobolus disseminans TaxID=1469910 RepID=A0A6A7ABF9_9PLEO|nr:class I glutamine amidotransferase-like protein [Ophiobolus disseminans]
MRISILALLAADLPTTFGIPSQPPISNTTKLPTHFGVLLFPHFQAVDMYGPMDLINSISMLYANQTSMHVTVLAKTLDPVSTAMMPGGFGQSTVPTMTFDDYFSSRKAEDNQTSTESEDCGDGDGSHAVAKRAMRFGARQMSHDKMPSKSDPGDIDVLIVPGGGGTRKDMTAEIAFVKKLYPNLQYIFSVCTGASILARAGVLDGKSATTNKRSFSWVASTGPNVKWVPTARWVQDGNVWTTSGINAGIDGAFAWVSHVYGDDVSDYMAKSLEHNRQTDAHNDPFGKIWDVKGAT